MGATLVLMRHGKAQKATAGQADFDRELTEAGKRALAATLTGSFALLDVDARASVQLWSSPAVRALQTAQTAQHALAKRGLDVHGGIEEHPELWEQDEAAFARAVADCDADVVVAVGHNPFMESVVEHLTGAYVPFATGGVCALGLAPARRISAFGEVEPQWRLLWFAQGPISQNYKTLVFLERVIRERTDAMMARRQAFIENPDDIETAHKLRVSIRTLRSLIAFIKPWQGSGQNAQMQKALRAVVRETSRLRELDVFATQAEQAEFSSDELVAFCEENAARERAAVLQKLSGAWAQTRLEKVCKDAQNIRWKRSVEHRGLPERDIRARFDELADALEHDLAALDFADAKATHDVRKDAKRVRYIAENCSELLGDDALPKATDMVAHQDNLGAICDARVNVGLANELLQQEVTDALAWELSLLRAENETYLYSALRENAR